MNLRMRSGLVVIFDDSDWELVRVYPWRRKPGRNTSYAMSGGSNGAPRIYMHRLILGLTDSTIHTDHIDGNGLNNRRSNLRECSIDENRRNEGATRGQTSNFKGVSWKKPRGNKKGYWAVQIGDQGKNYWIGSFKSEIMNGKDIGEIAAAKAYNDAALKRFGEFAFLNEIN